MVRKIIRSGGVIQSGREDPAMERIRAAIRGINPAFLDLPEIVLIQPRKPDLVTPSKQLDIIKGAIATAPDRRHAAALKEMSFEADVSDVERRKQLSLLATTFNKDFYNALKAIQHGKSLGYSDIDGDYRKTLLGQQYRAPFQEDVAVVTKAIASFWNEVEFSEELLESFDVATKRLSTIANVVNIYIDPEDYPDGSYPEPHEVVLRDDVFMETERFSLQGMAEQARDIVRYARPLAGRHI